MKLELLLIGFVVFFFVLIKNVYLVEFIVEYEGNVGFNSKNKFKWKIIVYKIILCMCGDLDCIYRYMCNYVYDF